MKPKDINPLISKIVETLDVEEIPGIILTTDIENMNFHLACTGKDNMGYIGVALEETFCTVKEDSESATQSQKVLVRMIFASLVRSYSREELDLRLEAWRRSVENNKEQKKEGPQCFVEDMQRNVDYYSKIKSVGNIIYITIDIGDLT